MRKTEFETIALEPRTSESAGYSARRVAPSPASASKVWGAGFQVTLSRSVELQGVGLHSGAAVPLKIRPAAAGSGIIFRRTDLGTIDRSVTDIPARYDYVCDTIMSTNLANEAGTMVGTVEHLMSALAGLGVNNAMVEVGGPEVPVMDGSAADFAEAIAGAGLSSLNTRRRAIRILKPVVLEDGVKSCALLPGDGFTVEFEIDFDNPLIGRQVFRAALGDDTFLQEVCRARTFGFLKDVKALWAAGLARGGSLDNAIVLDGGRVMNEDGLRFADEFVRHKVLDAIGDLALAGAPIIGRYQGVQAGHAMNNQILQALFADQDAWEYAEPGVQAPVSARKRPSALPEPMAAVAVSAD